MHALFALNTYRLCVERFCFFVTVASATSCTVTFGFDGGDIGAVTEPCRYGFESDVAERGGGSAMVVHLFIILVVIKLSCKFFFGYISRRWWWCGNCNGFFWRRGVLRMVIELFFRKSDVDVR